MLWLELLCGNIIEYFLVITLLVLCFQNEEERIIYETIIVKEREIENINIMFKVVQIVLIRLILPVHHQ